MSKVDFTNMIYSEKSHSLFSGFFHDGWTGFFLAFLFILICMPMLKPTGIWMSCLQASFKSLHQFLMDQSLMYVPKGSKGVGPFLSGVFFCMLFINLVSLTPLGVVYSAHIVFTLPLAVVLWATLVLKGLWNGRVFLSSEFLSSSIPRFLAIPFACLEILGHIIRPLTLSARFSVNAMAGHIMYKSVLAYSAKLAKVSLLKGGLVFMLSMGCFAAEICICFLQAYVFFILLNVYFNQYSKPKC
uniref:ATP synthase subunit a n=1 Tax=Lingula anatina TaxID=7574 RepID=Q5W907_LINAN|nr:ATP synthase F0 subunit 6 [Lingula anatina]BAD69577.1 ATP synthase subunit 6 [Lingula anatina]